MDSVNRYDDFAEVYDQLMLGGYYDYDAQLRSLQQVLPAGCRVLEIGVGTGLLAKKLADAGYVVSGVDHTPAMLERAALLLGEAVSLAQADVTRLDLGEMFDAVVSNGGVWYGVRDGSGHGYCGHLPQLEAVRQSVLRVGQHVALGGALVLSIQDRHADKVMELPDGVTYEQRIAPKGGGVFQKEYIFTRGAERIAYESLDLAYYDSEVFEGFAKEAGLGAPKPTADREYVVFRR